MKNKFLTFIAALTASGFIYAQQTGINTKTPTTTLQVVGDPANTAVADGITVPNLTGDQLRAKNAEYTAAQRGTTVYVTAADTAPAGQTINVTAAGYYYYDGALWQRVATPSAVANTIYNANGTLTGNRSVTQGNFDLNFDANTLVVDGSANSVGIGTNAPSRSLDVNGNAVIGSSDDNALADKTLSFRRSNGNINGIIGFETGSNTNFRYINNSGNGFHAFHTNNGVTAERVRIANNGNVGIGTPSPTATLDVNGQARVRNLPTGAASDQLLTADANGNIRKRTVSIIDTNIYDSNGTLTGNRSVTQGNFDLNFDANTLVVDGSANRVGIGTNAPTETLHINGTARVENLPEQGGYNRMVVADNSGNLGHNIILAGGVLVMNVDNNASGSRIVTGDILSATAFGGVQGGSSDDIGLEIVFPDLGTTDYMVQITYSRGTRPSAFNASTVAGTMDPPVVYDKESDRFRVFLQQEAAGNQDGMEIDVLIIKL